MPEAQLTEPLDRQRTHRSLRRGAADYHRTQGNADGCGSSSSTTQGACASGM